MFECMDGNRFPQLSIWKIKSIIWNNTHNIYIHPCMCLRSDYTHQYFKGCNNHLYMLWIYPAVSYLDTRPAASLITMIVIQCLTLCVICRLLHIILKPAFRKCSKKHSAGNRIIFAWINVFSASAILYPEPSLILVKDCSQLARIYAPGGWNVVWF